MKISDTNINGVGTNGVGKTGGVDEGVRQPRRSDTSANSVDQVSLSELSAAISAAKSDSPERLALLERLSAEFEAGRYNVDAEAVSKKLIEDSINTEFKE